MIAEIIKLELKLEFKSALVWLVVLALITVGSMMMFPYMSTDSMRDSLITMMESLPVEMLEAFNLSEITSLMELSGFYAYLYQYVFIASCIFSCYLGLKALIKDESDGVIEFIYAQPLTRLQLVLGKIISSLVLIVALHIGLLVASMAIGYFLAADIETFNSYAADLGRIYSNQLVILGFYFSVGFILSAIIRSSRQVMGLSLGIVFVTYIMGIISDLSDQFSWLGTLSLIHQGIPAQLMANNLSVITILGVCIVSVVLTFLAYWIYHKKDLRLS